MKDVELGPVRLGKEKRMMYGLRFADIGARRFPMAGVILAFGFQLVGAIGHDLAIFCVDSQRQLGLSDEIEGLHTHPVVGERQVADSFAEKNLKPDSAGAS